MELQPYLFFEGRCEEAIDFYQRAIDAEVISLRRYSDAPDGTAQCPDGSTPPPEKVMHADVGIGTQRMLMSDGFCSGRPEFKGFSITLVADDDDQAQRWFDGLGEGGRVVMPMGQTFFASRFGMLTDRYGLGWMVLGPNQPG